MIRYQKQRSLEGFDTPPDMILDPRNRWVRLSDCIPWDELADSYYKTLSPTLGRPSKNARMVMAVALAQLHRITARLTVMLRLPPSTTAEQSSPPDETPRNQGKLIIDTTVTEQAIRFPMDLGLLNEARELSERIIDVLYEKSHWPQKKKPRTYRETARKGYLGLKTRMN
jgi:hypothetical protein